MSNIGVNSNTESYTLTSLQKTEVTDPYTYNLEQNYPNGSLQWVKLNPTVGPTINNPHGSNFRVEVPKYQLIRYIFVRTLITTTGGDNAIQDTNEVGKKLYSKINLTINGNIISTVDSYYTQIRARNAGFSHSATVSMLSNPNLSVPTSQVTTFTAAGTVSVCTPLYEWFQEQTQSYYDSSFCEKMNFDFTVAPITDMGLAAAFTTIQPEVWVSYRFLSNEALSAYEANNFGPQKPLTMLIYNKFTEVSQQLIGTSTTMNLKCNYPVFNTHFFEVETSVANTTTPAGLGAVTPVESSTITDVTLTLSGLPVMQNLPISVLMYDESRQDKASILCTQSGALSRTTTRQGPFSIAYGEWSGKDRTFNSHSLSLGNTGQPQLIVGHTAATGTAYLVCVHEYWMFLNIDPINGRVNITSSI